MYPGQPLLLLKQSHNAHNLLVNFNDEGLFLCLNVMPMIYSKDFIFFAPFEIFVPLMICFCFMLCIQLISCS